MTKYSLVMTPTPCRGLDALSLLSLRIHAPVHLLTYTIGSGCVKPAMSAKRTDRLLALALTMQCSASHRAVKQESLANANVKRATAVHLVFFVYMTSIGTTVAKLWPFLYVQDGRQPPSWMLSNRK